MRATLWMDTILHPSGLTERHRYKNSIKTSVYRCWKSQIFMTP